QRPTSTSPPFPTRRSSDLIDRFKLLILPNIAALSDAQCDQLRQYVSRGGSLVATHETSLYDEWGVRRQNFGLSSLFGVKFNGRLDRKSTRLNSSHLGISYA